MNKPFYTFVGFMLLLIGLGACGNKPKSGRADTYSSGAIRFASDESFSPIIDEEKEIFERVYPEAQLTPLYTNELDAINLLMQDSICLAITSKNFTKKQTDYLHSKQLVPRAIPIAYDGLSLIVNNANTDTCITVTDIKRILSGQVKSWKELYPRSTRGDILVVFDNKQSSTVHYCVDSLLSGKPINSPNIMAAMTSKEVVEYVEKTPNAIGIIGSNWLNDKRDTTNTTFNKKIRVMSVSRMDKATPYNSWKPYQYYIYNGNYPLIRTIYALVVDPIRGLPWGFAQFIASPKGQMIIFKSGLLPVQGDITVRDVNVN